MTVALTRFSYWWWGAKDHENSNSAMNSSCDFPSGYREPDSVKLSSANGARIRSSSRRIKRKWQSREERRMDREYDLVLVPSDGGCLSGSDSDDSDWSIGWLEPHSSEFQCDSDSESSFAVLVPCYGRGRGEPAQSNRNHVLGATNRGTGFTSEGKDYLEQWLTSLQNM